ncbi:hypothetical protein LCGC14_0496980 [marine sediment metagenome]|uniref:Uncharacterized protein n=1 Tax=marine sediment metagenome TaxID=412755 RepID=A0A0F9S504_9ZZZZ
MIVDNTSKKDVVIEPKYINSLILFQQKIKEIEESRFFNFYFITSKNVHLSITAKKLDAEWIGTCSLNEPNEELIKAFILSFRFFIQGNENCSIKQIGDNVIPNIETFFPEQAKNIKNLRKRLNEYLDKTSNIHFKFKLGQRNIEFKSNREIKEIFIFGHYAHASSKNDKKWIYDYIHQNSNKGTNRIKRNLFRASAISILITLTNFVRSISLEIRKILDKIVDINIFQAEVALKNGNIKLCEKRYKNAIFIANALGEKEMRASIYLKLKSVYIKTNNTDKVKIYQRKYEEVKDSFHYLPEGFWGDDYYRNKFSLPDEYNRVLDEILDNREEFQDIPIIVLPIEKIHQLRRFEKLIIAKNFKVEVKAENIILYYEQIISKDHERSYWAHQKFEFNKNNEYVCRFPFIDDSGVVFLTNSKSLFSKWFLSWIVIRELIQSSGLNYVFLQRYVDYLVDIELENEINLDVFNRMRAIKNSSSLTYSIKGPEMINLHFNSLRRVLEPILEISTFPRLKTIVELDPDMDYIKIHIIEPFLKQKFKGLKWVSMSFKIILYIYITGNHQIIEEINDDFFSKLYEISKIIKSKPVSSEFFEEFFKFCDKYIQEYISNQGDPQLKKAWYNKGSASYILEQYNEAIEYFGKAVEIDPNDKHSWFYQGMCFFKIEEFNQSIQCYQKVLEIDSNDKQVWFYKGLSFYRLERYNNSIECYNSALESNPKDSQIWFYKGVSSHLLNDYEYALECFNKVIKFDPEFLDAWNKKAVVYYDLEEFPKAIVCCEKVIKIEPNNKQALYNMGISLLNLEKYNQAIQIFEKTIKIYPDFRQARNKLGFSLCKIKEFDKALKIFEDLLEMDPNDSDALINKGNCFYSLKQDKDAIVCYDKILNINPDNKFAWYNKGLALLDIGQFQQALDCYNKSLDIDPVYIDALINRGNSNCCLYKYELGIMDYDRALEIKPDNSKALYNKMKAFIHLEKYENALECTTQFLSNDKNDKNVWFEAGFINYRLKRLGKALEFYEEALKLDPQYMEAINNIGIIYAEKKEFNKAILQYNKALKIEPNLKEILYNKGFALDKLGRFTEAIENLDLALTIAPKYKEAWSLKGVLLGKIEKYQESIKSFEEVLRLDPNDIHALDNAAISYLKSGQYKVADKIFREVYQFDKDKGKFNYNQASLASLKKEPQKAINCLNLAISDDEKYRRMAVEDLDFLNIKDLDGFQALTT